MSPESAGSAEYESAFRAEVERLELQLGRDSETAFERYLALIEARNDRAGLTALREPAEVARRLFGESLALLTALRSAGVLAPSRAVRVADVGPGGGFPGVPMRIAEPAIELVLIEAQRRRCEFLETVTAELELEGVEVLHTRAEDAGHDPDLRGSFDLVVARAVAPLAVLVEYALPLLRVGGVLATPKGSRALDELTAAAGAIGTLGGQALDPVPLSLPEGAPEQQVLLVRRDGATNERYPRRAGVPSKRPLQ